jgi:type IV pilus assembly protein PilC
MIVTPGQLSQRAEFYYQLNQLTAAGLGLVAALQQLLRSPPGQSYRAPIQGTLDHISNGYSLSDSLARIPGWLPAFDLTVIEAGEKSGRLDACFRLLADHYADRARIARQMISDLIYPAFLLHLLVGVSSLVLFFWFPRLALLPVIGLGLVYALTISLLYAAQNKHGEAWRAWVESVLHPIPVLGAARQYLALSRLSAALEALISAGVTIIEAWELAATACGSPALRRTVLGWKLKLNAGQTPAETLATSSRFPAMFTNQYRTGEVSGKLDETLRRLHEYYENEGSRKLHAVARWVPILIYLLILIAGGAFVIWFWLRYYGQVSQILNGF